MNRRDGEARPRDVPVRRLPVPLGAFLKLAGAVRSGGEAKEHVGAGEVRVNGEVEVRRGRSLHEGDLVTLGGVRLRVTGDGA